MDGGFLALNYATCRDKDHLAAQRMREFRERQAAKAARRRAAQKATREVVAALKTETP